MKLRNLVVARISLRWVAVQELGLWNKKVQRCFENLHPIQNSSNSAGVPWDLWPAWLGGRFCTICCPDYLWFFPETAPRICKGCCKCASTFPSHGGPLQTSTSYIKKLNSIKQCNLKTPVPLCTNLCRVLWQALLHRYLRSLRQRLLALLKLQSCKAEAEKIGSNVPPSIAKSDHLQNSQPPQKQGSRT